jgi:hypothetical protein
MLEATKVTFDGCRIWLDAENRRELKRSIRKLERFFREIIGNPPLFGAVKGSYADSESTRSGRPK